ncbi:DUF7147 family protein [Bacillus fonticola]|uniref:DUF7147 family protein n=1 Tax=Bacillus fonticola TaxID=2728853 RepID=UPI001473DE7D|nr:methylthioribose kinase [Bacillus fonticola]
MMQRCIELGEGYADVYELFSLARNMPGRVHKFIVLHSIKQDKPVASFVLILKPTSPGDFQPIYLCREGIHSTINGQPTKRYSMFQDVASSYGLSLVELEVKGSDQFAELALYYQYLIGIFRLQHLLPPLA